MTIVYGGCIEPGGMELEDETVSVKWPRLPRQGCSTVLAKLRRRLNQSL